MKLFCRESDLLSCLTATGLNAVRIVVVRNNWKVSTIYLQKIASKNSMKTIMALCHDDFADECMQ